ncbi:MAG: hypothetical protein ABJF01_07560 [bacterium]
MMRLWLHSYARSERAIPSVALSVVAHAVLITGWVVATLPAAGVADNSIANHAYFIPPPDRMRGQQAVREAVHYVDVSRLGPGIGDGPRTIGDAPAPMQPDETIGRAAADTVTSTPAPPVPGPPDSVFSVLDVDTAVVRASNSAAPAYPLKLLASHVTGFVNARYTVDTTGFADTSSFLVMKSTNTEFIAAVRDALPYMRFKPAKIGPLKVRQLVEQQFTFKITDTAVTAPKAQKP